MANKTYEITDNRTGKTYEITGPRAPTSDEIQDLIATKLPKPSIMERVSAAALFPEENKRRAQLTSRGKTPDEPGFFYDEPGVLPKAREFAADIAESAAPFVKGGLQTAGEKAGAVAGTVLAPLTGGVINPVTGKMIGGGVGRGVGQALYEAVAAATHTGAKKGGAVKRIGIETAAGGVTTGVGVGVGKAASKFRNFPPVKKAEEFMLQNITRYPKLMIDWVKGRFAEAYKSAGKTKPIVALHDKVRKEIVPAIKKLKGNFGSNVTDAKTKIRIAKVQPNYDGLTQELIEEVFPAYGTNVTRTEQAAMLRLAKSLGHVGKKTRGKKRLAYVKAMDKVTVLGRKLRSKYGALEPGATRGVDPVTSMTNDIRKRITQRAIDASDDLGPALEKYKNFMNTKDLFDTYVGDTEEEIVKFLRDSVFDEEKVFHQDALNKMFSADFLGQSTLKRVKDLSFANFARSGEVKTAGVKSFIPSAIGGGIGGVIGGPPGAAAGTAIGGAITLPFMTPAWQASAYKALSGAAPLVKSPAARWIQMHGAKSAGKPLAAALEDLSGRLGIEISDEDLRSSRGKAFK